MIFRKTSALLPSNPDLTVVGRKVETTSPREPHMQIKSPPNTLVIKHCYFSGTFTVLCLQFTGSKRLIS